MRPAIRTATGRDRDAVVALDARCFGAAAWSVASWDDEFDRATTDPGGGADRRILVADELPLVGYAVLMVPAGPGDPVDLARIAVAPEHRRTGIGAQLLTATLAAVADRVVLLEVADSNEPARKLYARFGFVEISRRRGYYAGGEDAVIMEWKGSSGD